MKYDYEIMEIIDNEDEHPLNWSLLSTDEKVIPSSGHYLVRGQQILNNTERTCWMNISTPEMTSDYVFTIDAKNSKIVLNHYHVLSNEVIPNKLSNTFVNYEFYYTKINPQIGIDILKKEIENVSEKGLICEYLGYIYRNEGEQNRAIDWFLKCLEFGEPSSKSIYKEISNLCYEQGKLEIAKKYQRKIDNDKN